MRKFYIEFSDVDAQRIKEIEKTTNHDIKAVEYFLREKFNDAGLAAYMSFIHFGLTSQDINNTAVPYSLRDAIDKIYYPAVNEVVIKINELSKKWWKIPMLAHTHGQPASPTRVGKELMVFSERIDKQLGLLKELKFSAKFGGATGNFNAHHLAYPKVNWVQFANTFVNKVLRLDRSQTTTQIDHYDNLAAISDNLKRINTIIIDLDRDLWSYLSMGYFGQKINEGETGSSTMPHKVNPIDFENSEGNAGVANALFEHFSSKLPVSRLQRDLTDSTVLRNIGVALAHTLIALKSLTKGLGKLTLNEEGIRNDLENNWSVVSEAIQTVLRREGIPDAYELLKAFTRTKNHLDVHSYSKFIERLDVSPEVKDELNAITPFNYIGI